MLRTIDIAMSSVSLFVLCCWLTESVLTNGDGLDTSSENKTTIEQLVLYVKLLGDGLQEKPIIIATLS